MEEITPDVVARIASRLYNAPPQGAAEPGLAGGPGFPSGLAGLLRGAAPASAASLPGGVSPPPVFAPPPHPPAPPSPPGFPHPGGAPGVSRAPSLVHAAGSPGAPRAPGFTHGLGAPGVPRAPSTPHPAGGPGFPSAPSVPHPPGVQGYPTPPGVPNPAGAPGVNSPSSLLQGPGTPSPASAGSFPAPSSVPSGEAPPSPPHPSGAGGLPSSPAAPHPPAIGAGPTVHPHHTTGLPGNPAIPHLLGGVGLGSAPGFGKAPSGTGAPHAPASAYPAGAATSPSAPSTPPAPSVPSFPSLPSFLQRAGGPSLPSTTSMPTSVPHAPGGAPSFPGGPSYPGGPSLPGLSEASRFPTAPSFPTAANFPSIPTVPQTSQPAAPAEPKSEGLKGFIAQVRRSHFASGDDVHEKARGGLSKRLSSGKSVPADTARPLDVASIREDFPILRQEVHGHPLAWFDNAATTQKPQCVIDAISRFYENDNSNIHRAAHSLAARATEAYEGAREKVKSFLGASSVKEIVFARGTTEAINLVTQTYGRKFLQPGDEVVLSTLEHHASIVPWQRIAKETGAVLRVIPVNDRGEIILEDYQKILGARTKVVSITHASNSLGTILPVGEMTQMAKRYNARVLIDGAQSVAHIPVDVQQLGCDFFVFSGHKIFGPTGIGACFIREELHDILPPWQGGGNMIKNVTFEETTYSDAPAKFEAGTPNIADAVGLGAALDYVGRIGLSNIAAHEHFLLEYATERLREVPDLRIIGNAREKVSVISFVLPNRRTEEIGRLLDLEGIAVRSGHHCSQPSLRRFGVETTVRPSFSLYNTTGEIDRLVDAVKRIRALP